MQTMKTEKTGVIYVPAHQFNTIMPKNIVREMQMKTYASKHPKRLNQSRSMMSDQKFQSKQRQINLVLDEKQK
jgi:hypothetical protein